MTYNKKSIEDVVISAGQKVFVRCDFNVPMKDGVITSDKRIVGALPTIKYLMDKGAKVILSSHMGKPHAIFTPNFKLDKKEQKKVDELPEAEREAATAELKAKALAGDGKKFSLKPVADRLNEYLDGKVAFAADIIGDDAKAKIVLGLASVKANVLDQHAGAVLHSGDLCLCIVTDDVGCKCNLTVKLLAETVCNRLQGELYGIVLQCLCLELGSCCLALCLGHLVNLLLLLLIELEVGGEDCVGLTHVGGENYLCALVHQVLDGGECAYDSLIGGDHAVLHGNVEIATDKYLLTGIDHNVFNRFLVVSHVF